MTMEPTIVSKADFARLCHVSPGRVSQWIGDGRIKPEHLVGTGRNARIKAEPAQAYLRGNLDPAMARNEAGGGTNLTVPPAPASASSVAPHPSDERPDPEAYRRRTDLPGDFERGVLFAVHALGFEIPTTLACTAMECGATAAQAMKIYREARQDISYVVSTPIEAVGIVAKDADDCGQFVPTLFGGFNPNGMFS